ncbi:hypothetical protein HO173_011779 [Letharia columbiana]|uniref:Uncharacterized protein n=1 Tax=Letharia columbiana TaxID=112416 RepID=A0A8H6CS57_9LECA|nr:uncharacterized protein HO173_011779 [Letharia columbiana]KAF6228608.1 hypothetical protein HO173_011779 [Letharia columbiana]
MPTVASYMLACDRPPSRLQGVSVTVSSKFTRMLKRHHECQQLMICIVISEVRSMPFQSLQAYIITTEVYYDSRMHMDVVWASQPNPRQSELLGLWDAKDGHFRFSKSTGRKAKQSFLNYISPRPGIYMSAGPTTTLALGSLRHAAWFDMLKG